MFLVKLMQYNIHTSSRWNWTSKHLYYKDSIFEAMLRDAKNAIATALKSSFVVVFLIIGIKFITVIKQLHFFFTDPKIWSGRRNITHVACLGQE